MTTINNKGLASLPMIFVVVILIVAATVGISTVSLSEILITAGQNQSSQAYLYAEAGARDALMKLTRDYTFACADENCYQIDLVPSTGCSSLDGCAKVQVTNAGSPAVIISKGQVKNKTREIQVSVSYDSDGQITATAWQEVTD